MLKLKYRKFQKGQSLVEFAIIAPLFLFVIFTIVLGFIWVSNWVEWHDAVVRATTVGTTQNASPQQAEQTAQNFLQKVDQGVTIVSCYPSETQTTTCSDGTTNVGISSNTDPLAACPTLPTSPIAVIYICVPQFTTGSGNINGTASVEIYGWLPSAIDLPVWGNYLYSNVYDTQTLQVPSGDTNP